MTSKYTIHANNIVQVGDNSTYFASHNGKEFEALLTQALTQLKPQTELHQALQALQNDLKTADAPTKETQGSLKRALEVLPQADKTVGIVHKVVGTLVKLGWLSS